VPPPINVGLAEPNGQGLEVASPKRTERNGLCCCHGLIIVARHVGMLPQKAQPLPGGDPVNEVPTW